MLFLADCLKAQSDYSVASISPEMISNASAVIRLKDETLNISSESSATYTIRQVVTILNEEALSLSVYTGFTSKLLAFKFDKIIIYDKDGKKVKSFGQGELKPGITETSNIYDDYHFFSVDPDYLTYPFTAEMTYSVNYKGIFQLPDWYYYENYNVSKEKTRFTVTTPPGYKLRYREYGLNNNVKITKSSDAVKYEWEAVNLPALVSEPYSTGLESYSPSVLLAPDDFEIDGRHGSAGSWEKYGLFVNDLTKGRDLLEGPVIDSVRTLIAGLSDTTEMIKQIYRFMQKRTRYVSVQVGIGGWQPIEAQKVHQTCFGDCKGLVNYTRALLGLAGIKSYYTTVRAGEGEDDIITDFPSNQSNHIILCVPRGTDTIWLECTNQHIPFNYLGSFTSDRHVLVVSDKGGELVKTPRYTTDQNRRSRKSVVTIDHLGNATAQISTLYSHLFFDDKFPLLFRDQEDKKKAITNSIAVSGFTLQSFSVQQPDPDQPVITEDISIKLTKYATVMGDRMLIPVSLMSRVERLPSATTERKTGIEFRSDRMYVDTVIYRIPSGYTAPAATAPVEVSSPFGTYKTQVTVNGDEICFIRTLVYRKGIHPASEYPKLLEFNKSIVTADNTKIVLKKSA